MRRRSKSSPRSGALLGANVEIMAPDHHDLVLAITSHLPHLIAYTIVGTADELQTVTRSEVLKFSAGGFRDFTRIAASDPTMWRDVFLANKDAVLEMLGRFNEDVSALTKAIRKGDGDALFEHFTRTRAIRKGIVEIGQDSPAPDFGRPHPDLPHDAAAEALRRREDELKQRRRVAERNRPQEHRAVVEAQRQRSPPACLRASSVRRAIDAGPNIGAPPAGAPRRPGPARCGRARRRACPCWASVCTHLLGADRC